MEKQFTKALIGKFSEGNNPSVAKLWQGELKISEFGKNIKWMHGILFDEYKS